MFNVSNDTLNHGSILFTARYGIDKISPRVNITGMASRVKINFKLRLTNPP